jgi:LmbE family N-acetylglucosaminyl deacetylase
MKKIILRILLPITMVLHVAAQQSAGELLLRMRQLGVNASVMYLAAHPDDENTRLIAWLANERLYQTTYLSITRGDGGQNLIGSEQGPLLGLIRTNELMEARKRDGGQQLFTRANDFGYSKGPDETLKKWNKDSILSDMVFAIRKFKPDVIICRFPTTGEGGHGHHTASALLAAEAYTAAADPKRFSWQLTYTTVWQPMRLFWNTFNFGGTNTTSDDQLKIDVGGYNSLLGKSYGEIASESRTCHKSQGFGTAPQRGSTIEYFKQLGGPPVKQELLEGLDVSWVRFGLPQLDKILQKIIVSFDPSSPEKSIPMLEAFYTQLLSIKSDNALLKHYTSLQIRNCEQLIRACTGFYGEVSVSEPYLVPGQTYSLTARFLNRSNAVIELKNLQWPSSDSLFSLRLLPQQVYTFKRSLMVPENEPFSNPYWLQSTYTESLYQVPTLADYNLPESTPRFNLTYELIINKTMVRGCEPILHRTTDPVKGEKVRRPVIVPPVSVKILDRCAVFNQGDKRVIKVQLKANRSSITGTLVAAAPMGFSVTIPAPELTLDRKNQELTIPITVTALRTDLKGELRIRFISDGKPCALALYSIEYDHINTQVVQKESVCILQSCPLKGNQQLIAYVPGAGDEVAESLTMAGYSVHILSNSQLESEDLTKYQAIITGVRAYNTNEKLQALNERLLAYVEQGGNLIVQYNTNSRVGPLNARIGPFPFTVSRDRVTDERALVQFNQPLHPVLTTPNTITSDDFENWVQERGIYFATEIAPEYQTVFTMNDTGEKPHTGSLIIAKYGKGHFMYTGLAFFRQLPAGNSGAFRLMSNLINLKG